MTSSSISKDTAISSHKYGALLHVLRICNDDILLGFPTSCSLAAATLSQQGHDLLAAGVTDHATYPLAGAALESPGKVCRKIKDNVQRGHQGQAVGDRPNGLGVTKTIRLFKDC